MGFFWYLLALVLIIGLLSALYFARQTIFEWMQDTSPAPGGPTGLTLSDLRDLRKSGVMSDEEYERAKAQIVQGVQIALARQAAEKQAASAPKNGHWSDKPK